MKAVIYARYSSDSQREESIEGQLRECTEYAERNGITILRSYIDRALSARTADRPEFQNMIKDSEQKLFDVVLIWKLDRFSRDRYDSAHYKRILKKNGVKVVSVKENISDGPEGIILESMLEGYAEYYSAELSEKIQRGQKENALKRKNNGGNTPLGYVVGTDGVLAVDPLTAPLVTEIFTRYDSGESISEITASLNGRGLKTKKGKAFKIGGISLILKNRKYIGEYQYGSVIIPKGIPAIIDDDLFDRVQRRMAFNKKAPAKAKATEEYLLTTKLFCGTCERLMAGESGTSSTKGVKHYYYKCGGAKRKLGCKRKAVRKHWIERAAVLVTVQRVLQDDEISRIAEAIVALQEKEDTSLPAMRQQLTGCEKAIDNMLNAIQMGVLTASTKERLEKLEMQREELKLSILQAQMARPRYTKEQVVSWISRFKYGNVDDPQYQKQIIDTFINSIYVFDDKLVFTYNFKDGTETITLAEIQAAFGSDLTQVAPPYRMQSKPDAIAASGLLFAENRTAFHKGVSAQGNVFDLSCGRKAVALPAFRRASRSGLAQGYKMTARLFCTKRIHFLCAVCTGFVVSVWGLWYNNSKSAACAAMCMDAVFAAFGGLGAAQEMGGRAMRILGIDPGYAIVGFGALDYTRNTFTTLQYGAITTKAHTTFEDRLSEIYDDMTQLLAAVKPDAMAIETLFYTTNQKTVIAVAEARGVLLLCARQAGVPVFEYTPLQVKQSVSGYGKATKKQVQEMTRTLLKLPAVPKPDDTADALAMAICHAYSYRSKQYGVALTKRQQMGYF